MTKNGTGVHESHMFYIDLYRELFETTRPREERCGSVVERLTQDPGVAGSNLTGGTVLCS